MSEIIPTSITADRKSSELLIKWSDGEHYRISFEMLREACPCANCQGGDESPIDKPEDDFTISLVDARITQLLSIEAVGNYAIQPAWGDGHSAGIYGWQYLYSMGARSK